MGNRDRRGIRKHGQKGITGAAEASGNNRGSSGSRSKDIMGNRDIRE